MKTTNIVVDQVEKIVMKEGYRSLKFFYRVGKEQVLVPIDQLLMSGEIHLPDGPKLIVESGTDNLPQLEDPNYVAEDSGTDSGLNLESGEEIMKDEVADLIDNAANNPPAPQARSDAVPEEDSESESSGDENDPVL